MIKTNTKLHKIITNSDKWTPKKPISIRFQNVPLTWFLHKISVFLHFFKSLFNFFRSQCHLGRKRASSIGKYSSLSAWGNFHNSKHLVPLWQCRNCWSSCLWCILTSLPRQGANSFRPFHHAIMQLNISDINNINTVFFFLQQNDNVITKFTSAKSFLVRSHHTTTHSHFKTVTFHFWKIRSLHA